MGLFNFRSEFIDIVEWIAEDGDTIVHRFERHDNEIKNGANLIVRESQKAVFVDMGRFADVFEPGTYILSTANLPILSTLQGWKYGFDSPFKSEVYFLQTKRYVDLGWGTPNPVMLRDPEFGPIRIRAFGNYSIRIIDPVLFLKEVSGTKGNYTTDDVQDQLRNYIVSGFSDAVAESKIPVIDLSSKYEELASFCENKIQPKFKLLGLELLDLQIENISLPDELEKILDKRSGMNILGNLDDYTKFQSANAIEDLANNPSNSGSAGMGMGMGIGLGQNMMQQMNSNTSSNESNKSASNQPPPLPKTKSYYYNKQGSQEGPVGLTDIKSLIQSQVIQRETLVWSEGMDNWEEARQVDDLIRLFESGPPPFPK